MTARLAAATLLAAAALACAPAHAAVGGAAVACESSFSTVFNGGYVACQGPTAGSLGDSVTFDGWGSYALVGTSTDGSGAFAGVASGNGLFGTLVLGAAQSGSFVIGIEGGSTHSLYLFSGADFPGGLKQLDFDTFGIATASGHGGPALGRLALFSNVSAVPEPGSAAMLAAGLGALAFLARRRRPL